MHLRNYRRLCINKGTFWR